MRKNVMANMPHNHVIAGWFDLKQANSSVGAPPFKRKRAIYRAVTRRDIKMLLLLDKVKRRMRENKKQLKSSNR